MPIEKNQVINEEVDKNQEISKTTEPEQSNQVKNNESDKVTDQNVNKNEQQEKQTNNPDNKKEESKENVKKDKFICHECGTTFNKKPTKNCPVCMMPVKYIKPF